MTTQVGSISVLEVAKYSRNTPKMLIQINNCHKVISLIDYRAEINLITRACAEKNGLAV